ncbi:MAG TPA: glutaredoxin family protein [Methylococcus sp.]|nr:glutaredoxin family protein [Methylococcus sp.]
MIVWAVLLALMNLLPAFAANPSEPEGTGPEAVAIEVFVWEGCPRCVEAERFLDRLRQEQPALTIRIHDVQRDPAALRRLQELASREGQRAGVPAFLIGGKLWLGYDSEATTGLRLRDALARIGRSQQEGESAAESCPEQEFLSCGPEIQPEIFQVTWFGRRFTLEELGLPLFTVAMGLLDGFNPCSMWVLLLVISLLAPMRDRLRMLAVAGVFVAVEGIAYFLFMAAWLELFLLVGVSRVSEVVVAVVALGAGMIHLKDFYSLQSGFSLSIPGAAKSSIYARIRRILQAENLWGALIGAVFLAVLVQIVEFLCTSGFPALYTRILTLHQESGIGYYAYLLLYNLAYLFDDLVVLAVGVLTLSQRRLQEKEGRWLKLISGMVMVGLGSYLLAAPAWR